MTDFNCLTAGLVRLLVCPAALVFLRKKKGALIYPAFVAYGVCVPVFLSAYFIKMGFGDTIDLAYFIKRGMLYGIFEEGAKFIALKYLYDHFNSRFDSVSYAIGHGAYEEFGAGISCLALIGTDRAAPEIFRVNLWAGVEGLAFCAAMTVIIYYGIVSEKSRYTLPAAMILHTVSNMAGNILKYSAAVYPVRTCMTAAVCVGAWILCWKKLRAMDGE